MARGDRRRDRGPNHALPPRRQRRAPGGGAPHGPCADHASHAHLRPVLLAHAQRTTLRAEPVHPRGPRTPRRIDPLRKDQAMTDTQFPVASFAEALPYLRAPYTPELVYGRVIYTPDNIDAPCEIALYVSSETVMSRLNIVCDLHWDVRFEEVAERTDTSGEKTLYYVQIRAYVTVFGRT